MSRCLGFLNADPRFSIFIEKPLLKGFFKASISGLLTNAYKVHRGYAVCSVRSQKVYFLETNAKSRDPLKVIARRIIENERQFLLIINDNS